MGVGMVHRAGLQSSEAAANCVSGEKSMGLGYHRLTLGVKSPLHGLLTLEPPQRSSSLPLVAGGGGGGGRRGEEGGGGEGGEGGEGGGAGGNRGRLGASPPRRLPVNRTPAPGVLTHTIRNITGKYSFHGCCYKHVSGKKSYT